METFAKLRNAEMERISLRVLTPAGVGYDGVKENRIASMFLCTFGIRKMSMGTIGYTVQLSLLRTLDNPDL